MSVTLAFSPTLKNHLNYDIAAKGSEPESKWKCYCYDVPFHEMIIGEGDTPEEALRSCIAQVDRIFAEWS